MGKPPLKSSHGSEIPERGGRRSGSIIVLSLLASTVFGQTRVQLSQIRNLAQVSPAPVAPAAGGTQLSLTQLRWPGGQFKVGTSILAGWWDVGIILDMIAQVNTGRVFSYTFQGAKVFEYNRAVAFSELLNKLTPQHPTNPEVWQGTWNPAFTADSLDWFRMVAPYSSDDLPPLPK